MSAPLFGTWRAYILLIGVLLSGAGQTVIFTLLPPVARDLGLVELQAGTVFTVSAIFFTLLSPVWGRMSDRYGRRIFLVAGMIGVAISMFGFGAMLDLGIDGTLSGNLLFAGLVAMRSLAGIAGSAIAASGLALVADLTEAERRGSGMAMYAAAFGMGSILGPSAAGLTASISLTFPLYALAVLGILAAIALVILLPHTAPQEHDPDFKPLAWSDPRIVRLLLYSLLAGSVLAIPMQVAGFYMLDALGKASAELPVLLGIVLAVFAGSSLAGQLSLVRGLLKAPLLLWLGPLVAAIGAAVVAIGGTLETLFVGMVLCGFGTGVVLPSAIAVMSLRVVGREQGGVAGMTNSASAVGFILAPFVGLGLHTLAPPVPFVALAVLGAVLALPFWRAQPGA